ncbi:MAG: hypothetical protein JST89_23475 [Cyanobacteria bacterium SZAS-4]|nr:hypothetical protein [Cyanobacteria bacterium SZAS-4]
MKEKIFKTRTANNAKITEVSGGIANGDVSAESNTARVETVSKPDQKRSQKISRYFLNNSKLLTILMTVVLFMATCLWLSKKNADKELMLRKYTSQAELSELDFKFVAATDQWHRAIKIAETMSDKRKMLGDLHLRAATAEWQVTMNEQYLLSQKSHMRQSIINAETKPYADLELADLQTALAIYQKLPNTKADQVAIIDKLKPILGKEITEFRQMLPHSPYIRYALNITLSEKAEATRQKAIQDMRSKKPGLGLEYFKDYIRETRNSYYLLGPVLIFAQSLPPDEKSIFRDLVPILYEIIYHYDAGPRNLMAASYWLDYALKASGENVDTFEARMKIGDNYFNAHNYHAALLEYYRSLGFKFDQVVHEKLLKTLQLCREQDQNTPKPPTEYIALLTKSKALNMDAYGLKNLRTQDDITHLGLAYGVSDRFEDAERELLLGNPMHSENMQPNAFSLADIYAREGKPDKALEWYQRGKALEKDGNLAETRGVWARMAFVCIRSGRWKEAAKYIDLQEAEPSGDSFGSNSFGTIHQPMME